MPVLVPKVRFTVQERRELFEPLVMEFGGSRLPAIMRAFVGEALERNALLRLLEGLDAAVGNARDGIVYPGAFGALSDALGVLSDARRCVMEAIAMLPAHSDIEAEFAAEEAV